MNLESDPISGGLGFQEFDVAQPESVSEAIERDLASRKPPNFDPSMDQREVDDTSESIDWAE